MKPSIVVVDERAAGPQAPFGEAINRALDAGCWARLRPTPRDGLDLVRNDGAILATDFDGMPVGTYSTLMHAVHAWRIARGVAEPIAVDLPAPRALPAKWADFDCLDEDAG